MPSATRSPRPPPRAASAAASWLERASSSPNVSDTSLPSMARCTYAISSPRVVARARMRWTLLVSSSVTGAPASWEPGWTTVGPGHGRLEVGGEPEEGCLLEGTSGALHADGQTAGARRDREAQRRL